MIDIGSSTTERAADAPLGPSKEGTRWSRPIRGGRGEKMRRSRRRSKRE